MKKPSPAALVRRKLRAHGKAGEIKRTADIFLIFSAAKHHPVRDHMERVALLSESTARNLGEDAKAAFLAGLLHDIGKLTLPHYLFDGRNITPQEYDQVKEHAIIGFNLLRKNHPFSALCAGLHHALYKRGYGLSVRDFPKCWSPETIKKVLTISAIISICDFVDAYKTRKTTPKDFQKGCRRLKDVLCKKYPNDKRIIEAALRSFQVKNW